MSGSVPTRSLASVQDSSFAETSRLRRTPGLLPLLLRRRRGPGRGGSLNLFALNTPLSNSLPTRASRGERAQ
jgi:hypothetical protein